ncbi:FAD-dependent oxidoreductase [Actinomadura sp. 3N407]|uniref:FAD-dependent oxidoreductase n=1 Tax=Actinomadura sp. 3N407 TaxID=3457423 RepID=UPI003FCC6B7B
MQLTTTAGPVRAKAAVLAIPLPALRRIAITPPLPEPLTAAMNDLRFGTATKISARVASGRPIRPRAVVGGSPLGIAWRTGQVISGITAETGHDWTTDPWSGGSYIAFGPGRLTRHGAALRTPHGRLAFAAAERSSWPNSIEGALESGHTAATRVRALLATT